jgi:hypothetical protein
MVWALPLLAALFFYDTYRTASGYPPVWDIRASLVLDKMLFDFGAFAGGLSAWAGSREGRRQTRDMVAATARPVWMRQAAALAGPLFWVLLAFLAGVAVLYIQTARQATWGGPPLWPVAVGVTGLITICAIGFTAGALFPGRFTAPLVAVGVLVLDMVGFRQAVDQTSTYALLSPSTSVPPQDTGLFYPVAPDVAIAQVMFMGGITIAVLGVLALSPALRLPKTRSLLAGGGTGRLLPAVAVVIVAAGVAAAGTAYGLTGTARHGVSGWDIPALHDGASDQSVAYTPDCAKTGFQVCVHPAFSSYLDGVAAALDPVAAEVAGLPGAPARAEEMAGNGAAAGTSRVYGFTADDLLAPFPASAAGTSSAQWRAAFQQDFLSMFVGSAPHAGPRGFVSNILGPAQQAVVTALMTAVGSQPVGFAQADNSSGKPVGPSPAQIAAAAERFAALSPAARHAWLAAHLPALRASHITLAQLP